MVDSMASKILEIEDDEIVIISGTRYARIPSSWDKSLGLANADGSKTTKKIKRAKIRGKHGIFMGIWGILQEQDGSDSKDI